MKLKNALICSFFLLVSLLAPLPSALAADGVWTAGTGTWTDTSKWLNGIAPGAGETASFSGPGGTVTIPINSPFSLSALLFNTNNANVGWSLAGGSTNTLVAPATVEVGNSEATFAITLAGAAGLSKTGPGWLNLANEVNLFTGPITVSGSGSLRVRADATLGAATNPVTLDGASLASYGAPLTLNPARVVTAGPSGAWFLPRYTFDINIHSRITGPGALRLPRESSFVTLSNPANDYAGDTVLGTTDPGSSSSESARARLVLGADEVLPDSNALIFEGDKMGILDLNGHSETVRTISATQGLVLTSSVPNGTLHTDAENADIALSGSITADATLDKQGSGTLHFPVTPNSDGGIRLSEGALVFSSGESLGKLTLTLDGGSLQVANWLPGLTERRAAATGLTPTLPLAFNSVRLGIDKALPGMTLAEFGTSTQYGYFGKWYVPTSGTYSFGKSFDDGALLKLDGQTLINNNSYNTMVVTQNVAVAAGWHDLEVRLYNGIGNVGPRPDLHGPFPAGIAFDPANGDFSNPAIASVFEDPGDGSILRTIALSTTTNTFRTRLELVQDSTLDCSDAPTSPLLWTSDLVTAADAAGSPKLTITGGTKPISIGSPDYFMPAIFDTDIVDANGVIFQDRLWINSWPQSSTYTIRSGTELAEGRPGILGTGDLTLSEWSLRIVRDDSAIGTVTVTNNRFVRFDATREEHGRLINDPHYLLTADNDVVLGGTGTIISFNGAGSVNYSGIISGTGQLIVGTTGDVTLTKPNTFSGMLNLNKGRLLVSSDAELGNPANVVSFNNGWLGSADNDDLILNHAFVTANPGGGFDTPENTTLTLTGPLSGAIAKRGAGTLAIGGSVTNTTLDLAVDAGIVTLLKNGATRDITSVNANATLRLDGAGGDLIARNVTLSGGTLDLNGHSETINALSALQLPFTSRVINNGAELATLTVGKSNAFSAFRGGWLADGLAPLALTKIGTSDLWLMGAQEPMSYTGPTLVEAGTLHWGGAARYVRFTILATRSATAWPSVSEFQLLLDGELVPYSAVATASASSPATSASGVVDNNADTRWQAPNPNAGHWFTLNFGSAVAMNGYRWFTHAGAATDDPVSWRVEVSSDNSNWYTVDERFSVAVPNDRRFPAGAWSFRPYRAGNWTASPESAVTVSAGATAELNSPHETIPALAGQGTLAFVKGTTLRVEDASGFSGNIVGAGTLELTGLPPSPLVNIPAGATLVNAGTTPLSVSVGGAANGAFAATLRDGTASIGLRKTGPSTLKLLGAGSDYTGDTVVEAGTLALSGVADTYRFVRFSTSEVRDPNGANNNERVSLGEFQLTLSGTPVVWPAGTIATAKQSLNGYGPEKAIDGDWINAGGRWIGIGHVNWLKLDLKNPIAFDGYQFYTAMDASYDWSRDPISWTFEGSNDGTTWTLLDSHTRDIYPNLRSTKVGPFLVTGAPVPVPSEFWAITDGCADTVGAVAARFLRFTPTRMRLGAYEYPNGMQFAELELRLDGATVPYPAGTLASAPGGGYNMPLEGNVLTPNKAVDNILPTQEANNRWYSQSLVNPLTVDMGAPVTFNSYRIWTAQNGAGRDPLSWTMEISADGTNWFLADTQTNQWGTLTRKAVAGEWHLKLPARGGQLSGAIPETSRTQVAAGATLQLNNAAERVGPLSGSGTVALVAGSTLGINAFEEAVFDGVFTGSGTLAIGGAAQQRFENAGFAGVTNLLLKGDAEAPAHGVIAGTAATSGNLAVTFAGGAYGAATIHAAGALKVAGPVRYALPAGTVFPYSRTLFTFGSIDANSRAALIAGADSVAAPAGMAVRVKVWDTSATLFINYPGTIFIIR